jgi:hypothetical protein
MARSNMLRWTRSFAVSDPTPHDLKNAGWLICHCQIYIEGQRELGNGCALGAQGFCDDRMNIRIIGRGSPAPITGWCVVYFSEWRAFLPYLNS